MTEPDPVHDIERSIAVEIAALMHRLTRWRPGDVHVHFREDTIVYLLDGPGLPHLDPVDREAMHDGLDEVIGRTLQRGAARPVLRRRLSEESILIMVRLI
jgi:hypothetical protein